MLKNHNNTQNNTQNVQNQVGNYYNNPVGGGGGGSPGRLNNNASSNRIMVYSCDHDTEGSITLTMGHGKKLDHMGIQVKFFGRIDMVSLYNIELRVRFLPVVLKFCLFVSTRFIPWCLFKNNLTK